MLGKKKQMSTRSLLPFLSIATRYVTRVTLAASIFLGATISFFSRIRPSIHTKLSFFFFGHFIVYSGNKGLFKEHFGRQNINMLRNNR